MKNEIIFYQADKSKAHIEVRVDEENETFWLTQEQIAELFERNRTVISKHLKNIFNSRELDEKMVCAFFTHTTPHGAILGKIQKKLVKYYNLDAILSVGYRVNSQRGTQFRIWANKVLKDHLLKGYTVNNRISRIEDNLDTLKDKVQQIDLQIHSNLIPTQGIFFEGQVFDAYELTSRIIRSARKSIVLIDNYIDENTLTHLSKKDKNVVVSLLSKDKSAQLDLDLKKANAQYGNFAWQQFDKSHDRFLIIDQNEVYHLGASLKDLGKKWFAFSKLNKQSVESMLNSILEVIMSQ